MTFIRLIGLLLLLAGISGYAKDTYSNPVIAENLPDPCVLQDGDRYYLYATESKGKNADLFFNQSC